MSRREANKNKRVLRIPTQANTDNQLNPSWMRSATAFLKINATPLVLLLVSLTINLVVISDYRNSPFAKITVWDADIYWKWAQNIAAGNLLGNAIFHQTPLYPYFLSILVLFFGKNLVAVYIVQAILGAFSVVLVYSIAKATSPRNGVGVSAALLFAFYGMQVFYTTKILSECLSIFLLLLSTRLLMFTAFSKTRIAFAGVAVGLLLIAKPHFMLAVPLVLGYLLFKGIREKCRPFISAGLFLVPILLVVGSVTVRNYVVGKDFVLISSNGGESFFIGNNEKGNGTYARVEGISQDIEYQNEDVNALAALKTGHQMKRSEVSTYWFRQGINFIVRNPKAFLMLEWTKIKYLFSGVERSTMYYLYFEKQNITRTMQIPFVNYYLLLPLFAAGLIVAVARWKTFILPFIFMFVNMLNMLIFFYDTRFMLLSIPYWAIVGGLAIGHIGRILKNGGVLKALKQPATIALFLCAGLSYFIYTRDMKVKKPDWHMQMTLGDIYLDLSDLDAALKAFVQSSYLKQNDWMPVFGVSKVYFRKGNKDVSAQLYNEAFPNLNADFKKLVLRDKDLEPIRQYIKEHKAAAVRSVVSREKE